MKLVCNQKDYDNYLDADRRAREREFDYRLGEIFCTMFCILWPEKIDDWRDVLDSGNRLNINDFEGLVDLL